MRKLTTVIRFTTPCCGVVSFCNTAFAALCLLANTSCSKPQSETHADVLAKVDKHTLTKAELMANMPVGVSEEDSAVFASAFIKSWINATMISQLASKEIEMTEIDKMVEQYRNQLIMHEYSRQMYASHANAEIPEDSIRAYYDGHTEEFVLSRPMVKGVYVKIADDAKALPEIRKIYRSTKEKDIDNLDKSVLNGAVHYDYFRDRWVDWEQVEARIPYDFGESASAFLRDHKNVDTSVGGYTYLLDISDVLPAGKTMPYEAARPLILDRLTFRAKSLYADRLKKELYQKWLDEGKIQVFCDLP